MTKLFLVLSMLMLLPLSAHAGRLLKCEGVSTSSGFIYIGTYCVDFACNYVTRRSFRTYCPHSV